MRRSKDEKKKKKKAQELDPLSLIINTTLGKQLYLAGKNEEAVEQLRKVLDIDAKFAPARPLLVEVYEQMGKQKEAVAERKKIRRRRGSRELAASSEEDYTKGGYKKVVQSWMDGLTEISKYVYLSPYSVAQAAMRTGDKEKTFSWLEKAYEEHDSGLVSLAVEPVFEPLRTDSRFKDLIRRMKLPN
jgi:lipopolysaccharide biosynthesis regulator YciM